MVDVGHIILATLKSSVGLLAIAALGFVLRKFSPSGKITPPSTQIFWLFGPSMAFLAVSKQVNLEVLSQVWIVPVSMWCCILLGVALSVVTAKLFRLRLTSRVTVTTIFMSAFTNSSSFPYYFVEVLVGPGKILGGDVDQGRAYVALSTAANNVIIWSVAFPLLAYLHARAASAAPVELLTVGVDGDGDELTKGEEEEGAGAEDAEIEREVAPSPPPPLLMKKTFLLQKILNPTLLANVFGIIVGCVGIRAWLQEYASVLFDVMERLGGALVPSLLLLLGYFVCGISNFRSRLVEVKREIVIVCLTRFLVPCVGFGLMQLINNYSNFFAKDPVLLFVLLTEMCGPSNLGFLVIASLTDLEDKAAVIILFSYLVGLLQVCLFISLAMVMVTR